jgi:hypothetical protein
MEIPGRKIESHQGISFSGKNEWQISRLLSFDCLTSAEQQILIRANWKKLIGYLWALYCEPTDMMAFTQEPILLKACQTG